MSNDLLTQYSVLSERRLHFGRMYWQNIAFHGAGLLAAAAIFKDLTGAWLAVVLVLAGLATLLMGFIASRLRGLEVTYETLLGNIEDALIADGHKAVQKAPVSGRYGARYLVNLALGAAGLALIAWGVAVLLGGPAR